MVRKEIYDKLFTDINIQINLLEKHFSQNK